MNNCIFCKIIKKEIPANIVYEDDKTLVFMDISPVSDGHILVIPRKHYLDLSEMPINEYADLFNVVKLMQEKLMNVLNCEGIHILTNVGTTQEVKHLHIHLIPVYEGEKVLSQNIISNKDNFTSVFASLKKSN